MRSKMQQTDEVLDFCRAKKIFEKGFGFLSSLYHEENVFFHFSKIKDENVRKELENMKRGVVYIFYTSQLSGKKRRVSKIWIDIKLVEKRLIPAFIKKIIEDINVGKTNPFEIAHVIKLLLMENYISKEDFRSVLTSIKISRTPSILIAMLDAAETKKIDDIKKLIDDVENTDLQFDKWVELVLEKLYA